MSTPGTFVRRYFEPLVLVTQVLVDLAVVLLACWTAYQLREWVGWRSPIELSVYREVFLLTAAVCLVCFHSLGMYSPIKSLLNIEEFKAIAKSTVIAFFVVLGLILFLRQTPVPGAGPFYSWLVRFHKLVDLESDPSRYSRLTLFLAYAFILVYMTVNRFICFKVIQMLHRRRLGNRNVLIYGTGPTALRLQRKFVLVPTLGLNLVGFLTEEEDQRGQVFNGVSVLGGHEDIEAVVSRMKVSEVFVALPESSEERVMEIIEELERLGIVYHVVPRFYHLMTHKVRIENLDSIPLITLSNRQPSIATAFGKRVLDLAVSALVLTLGAPFFVIPALFIKRESPGPVFFRQTRIGRNGEPFEMFKFRTMFHEASGDGPSPSSRRDPRITRIGRFLRRYSLDELPQFINVFRGEMSLVGPRPEMAFIVDGYGPLERERLRAKPGVTGLWQISYARGGPIHENLDYDIYYIENQSLLLDLVILALTGFAVVRGTGAY